MNAASRADAMIDARRVEATTKRTRVLAALEDMAAEGIPITSASVARRAGVSTWLVYAPGVREAVETARARERRQGPAGRRPAAKTTPVTTDLALARAEISRLRAERDTQRQQLSLALGARLDDVAKADLLTRVDELTRHNTQLAANLATCSSETAAHAARIVGLEDDLAAARTSLRRMIRAENQPTP